MKWMAFGSMNDIVNMFVPLTPVNIFVYFFYVSCYFVRLSCVWIVDAYLFGGAWYMLGSIKIGRIRPNRPKGQLMEHVSMPWRLVISYKWRRSIWTNIYIHIYTTKQMGAYANGRQCHASCSWSWLTCMCINGAVHRESSHWSPNNWPQFYLADSFLLA